jgi:hypothetical protein
MKPLRREMRRSGQNDPDYVRARSALAGRDYFLRVRDAASASVWVPEVLS